MVDIRVDPCRGLVVVGAAGDHEGAAGSQDAGDVGDRGGGVGHEVDGVGGDRGVDAVVGEGDGDAVPVSQSGAAVAAGGTVARRGLLDHRGRWSTPSTRWPARTKTAAVRPCPEPTSRIVRGWV